MARSIGADQVIDYTGEDFVETERQHDLLFDNIGTRPWSETKRVLTADGFSVTITGPKHRWLGPCRRLVYDPVAQAGAVYYQECYEGEAEDMADVVRVGDTITVAAGTFHDVLVTREWNPLEPGVFELKYYALRPGWIGTIRSG